MTSFMPPVRVTFYTVSDSSLYNSLKLEQNPPMRENPMADQNLKPELFQLNNGTMRVLITNLGCTITSLSVPGKDGKYALHLSV